MGFTLAGQDDQLLILYKACHSDTKVYRVSLYDFHETHGDAADDTLLWEIRSDQGTIARGFLVGAHSTGFETTMALAEPLEGRALLVNVATDELDDDEEFLSMSDLRAGSIRLGDKYVSAEEFSKHNSCG